MVSNRLGTGAQQVFLKEYHPVLKAFWHKVRLIFTGKHAMQYMT